MRSGTGRTVADMFGLGAPELMIVLLVILVLFGGSKVPALARSLGQAKRELHAGMTEESTPNG